MRTRLRSRPILFFIVLSSVIAFTACGTESISQRSGSTNGQSADQSGNTPRQKDEDPLTSAKKSQLSWDGRTFLGTNEYDIFAIE